MKARISVMILMVVVCLFLAVPSMAQNRVDKVRDFLEMQQYSDAYELLMGEEGILRKHPKNLQAQILLGVYYLGIRSDSRADERFGVVLKQDVRLTEDIGKVYKEAAQDAFERKNITLAQRRFQKAIAYHPSLANQAGPFFIKLGDNASGNLAVECYRMALNCIAEDQQKEIARRLLRLAVMGIQTESIKQEVAQIIGQAKIDEIFPKPQIRTVFEKTYAFADAYDKEYGQIAVINFSDYPIKPGDVIEVIARVSGGKNFSGKEIYIWKGKNFTPKWAKTSNGYYQVTVEKELSKGRYIVSLDRRKDIEVTVRLVRKVFPKPNTNLLASL